MLKSFTGEGTMTVAKEQMSSRSDGDDGGLSLSEWPAIATLPAADLERARRFYTDKLGLSAMPGSAPGTDLFRCGGTMFAVYETSGRALGTHDQMGFTVSDLDSVARQLKARGVSFRGDVVEDERTRTAWFKDSEGNLIMLREILACAAPNGGGPAHR
jgi:catechol 2,3-dioxygenase-like lactoylglutathione lyase family enzyme